MPVINRVKGKLQSFNQKIVPYTNIGSFVAKYRAIIITGPISLKAKDRNRVYLNLIYVPYKLPNRLVRGRN